MASREKERKLQMREISILHPAARSKDDEGKYHSAIVVNEVEITPEVILKEGWSPGLFTDKRIREDFRRCQVLGLDIDNGFSLQAAIEIFKDYWHIIGTTQNHQKIKNVGKSNTQHACDRFRIILAPEEDIMSADVYKYNLLNLAKTFKITVDEIASDVTRWFVPCKEIISSNLSGKLIPIFHDIPKKEKIKTITSHEGKGKLSRATLEFLSKVKPDDPWHPRFVKAVYDHKEQGYTKDEAIKNLSSASPVNELDAEDLRQVEDIYENRDSILEFRINWPDLDEKKKMIPNSYLNQRFALEKLLGYSIHLVSRRELVCVNHESFPKPEYLTDGLFAKLSTDIRQFRLSTGESLRETIQTIARENKKDPVLDEFNILKWDGKENIKALFQTLILPKETTEFEFSMYEMYLKRWLIGVVAKIMQPGSENNVLVFQGQQAAGKSRWFQRFAEIWPDGYGEGNINPEEKDHELRHLDNFIWHVAEFDSTTSRREVGALKDFFTKHTVSVRRPYSRYPIVGRSSCSFCATVNNLDFLHDLTGNRRYLSIPVIGTNPEHSIDIKQVFAEAKHLYDSGERQWFTREEIDKVNELNAKFMSKDDYIESVEARVSPGDRRLSTTDILMELGFVDMKVTKGITSSVRATLAKKGIEQKTSGGVRYYRVQILKLEDIMKDIQ